ncbi:MAG: M20 family metallopeptidase [Gammaproteobacteria bacterium]
MDAQSLRHFIERQWDTEVTPRLMEYIRIPNKSPLFDDYWVENGHMERAVRLAEEWCREQPLSGMSVEVIRLADRTPLLWVEVPGTAEGTVLLYGHLDKQPEMGEWREGLGPWEPVLEGDRLYGRGGADDGYALFASLLAIGALQEQALGHARCVLLIECCEESGSWDLPDYLTALGERIGQPDLVICLDSGCGNYEQLWLTTSLRGAVSGDLTVRVLREGVHSGDASGVVPSSFRILRSLIGRIEEADSGAIIPPFCRVPIPERRRRQAQHAAKILGSTLFERFPFEPGTMPVSEDPAELILNRTWRPALSVTGADGLPALAHAGNTLRPYTSLRLSLRIPPRVSALEVQRQITELLTEDVPYRAGVTFTPGMVADGWEAPELSSWLERSLERASQQFFGREVVYMGEGGTIPFMAMLGERFPEAQFVITGVLGPHSNAHGPNEFLHLPTAKRLTACVARILFDHAQREH